MSSPPKRQSLSKAPMSPHKSPHKAPQMLSSRASPSKEPPMPSSRAPPMSSPRAQPMPSSRTPPMSPSKASSRASPMVSPYRGPQMSPPKRLSFSKTPALSPTRDSSSRPGSPRGPASGLTIPRRRSGISEGASNVGRASEASRHPKEPERQPAAGSNTALLQRFQYTSQMLARRDISPRTEKYYSLFKDEISRALNAKTPEEKLKSAGGVEAMERVITETAFLRPGSFSQTMEMETALIQLRELQYLARYGDYMKIVTGKVHLHGGKTKYEGWKTLSGQRQWTEIAEIMEKEQDVLAASMRSEWSPSTKSKYPVLTAVENASRDLGFDPGMVKWSIHTYAARNAAFHKDLEILAAKGSFGRLAAVLYHDLRDIYCVFSETRSETHLRYLEQVIRIQIDSWYDTSDHPDIPESWIPKQELRDILRKATDKEAREVAAEKLAAKKLKAAATVLQAPVSQEPQDAVRVVKLDKELVEALAQCGFN